jgi:hypothetical protein
LALSFTPSTILARWVRTAKNDYAGKDWRCPLSAVKRT